MLREQRETRQSCRWAFKEPHWASLNFADCRLLPALLNVACILKDTPRITRIHHWISYGKAVTREKTALFPWGEIQWLRDMLVNYVSFLQFSLFRLVKWNSLRSSAMRVFFECKLRSHLQLGKFKFDFYVALIEDHSTYIAICFLVLEQSSTTFLYIQTHTSLL